MKIIIVDERIEESMRRELAKRGFFILTATAHRALPDAIASHPDSLFYRQEKDLFTYADYAETALPLLSDLREYIRDVTLHFVSECPGKSFPEDCRLNALSAGGKVFCREESLSESVLEFIRGNSLTTVKVKQGYPACSVLKLNESHCVTSDPGMARSLRKEGIDTLLVTQGAIALPPYEYGFIGGASFVHGGTVYFFGNIESHPDGKAIINYIKEQNLEVVSLSDGALTDLGGALVFEQ